MCEEPWLRQKCYNTAARPQGLAATLSSSQFGTKCYHYCLEVTPCNANDFQGHAKSCKPKPSHFQTQSGKHASLQVANLLSLICLQSFRQDGAGGERVKREEGIFSPVNSGSLDTCGTPSTRSAEAEASLGQAQVSL